MDLNRFLNVAIRPALQELEKDGIRSSKEAERFMLAIALQESRVKYRKQIGQQGMPTGPANSYWQFERGGGVKGVLNHASTKNRIAKILALYDINNSEQDVWEAMRYHDIVAACMARLLIFTLPNKLPTTAQQGWDQYISAWRPGKPHRATWDGFWNQAGEAVKDL